MSVRPSRFGERRVWVRRVRGAIGSGGAGAGSGVEVEVGVDVVWSRNAAHSIMMIGASMTAKLERRLRGFAGDMVEGVVLWAGGGVEAGLAPMVTRTLRRALRKPAWRAMPAERSHSGSSSSST